MPGRNRFAPNVKQPLGKGRALSCAPSATCVFISHKREDADLAKAAADTLCEMNVDVWLDLTELGETQPAMASEHLTLTEAIETGLQNSTHLLALITPRTQNSWWVPFEIGVCRALRKEMAFFLHRDLPGLPSYLVVGEWLCDQQSFFAWAERLSATPTKASLRALVLLTSCSDLDPYMPKTRTYEMRT